MVVARRNPSAGGDRFVELWLVREGGASRNRFPSPDLQFVTNGKGVGFPNSAIAFFPITLAKTHTSHKKIVQISHILVVARGNPEPGIKNRGEEP